MTFLSGFLLLLCVEYTISLGNHPYRSVPFFNIQDPLGRFTPKAKVGNKKIEGFKDFSGLNYFLADSNGITYRAESYEHCYAICKQTIGCTVFTFVKGIDYGDGCYMYKGKKDDLRAEIAPIYTGNISCPANKRGCITKDVSYEGKYRIAIRRDSMKYYPRAGGEGYAGCQEYCKKYSGNKGIRHEHINWRISRPFLKNNYPNGIVPCASVTYEYLYKYTGFCLFFALNAPLTQVIKISGPTLQFREEEEAELQNAINDPNFHNVAGHVLDMTKSVQHLVNITNPKKCQAACQGRSDCGQFEVIIGMPPHSGCHLFRRDAQYQQITVMSGEMSCPAGTSDCAKDVTKDVTYGEDYEMILVQGHQFKKSGIKECQKFCGAWSGGNGGYPFSYFNWEKTGKAVDKETYKRYKCSAWTYIRSPLGEKCKVFAKGSRQIQIHYRSGTELPSVNAKLL